MSKPDPVLASAQHMLDGTLCECSHWESDHRQSQNWPKASPNKYGPFCEDGCRCPEFRPVELTVARKRATS